MPEFKELVPLEDERVELLMAELRALRAHNPNQAQQDGLRERLMLAGVSVSYHSDGSISWERHQIKYEVDSASMPEHLRDVQVFAGDVEPVDTTRMHEQIKKVLDKPPGRLFGERLSDLVENTAYAHMPVPLGDVVVAPVPLEPKTGNYKLRCEQIETIEDLHAALADRDEIRAPGDLVRRLVLALAKIRHDFDELTTAPDPSTDPLHVDRFIEEICSRPPGPIAERYAAWWFYNFRLKASFKLAFQPFLDLFELYCTYKGERFRVTGASRLGDVWLARSWQKKTGYDLRVAAVDCSEWGWCPGWSVEEDEKPDVVMWQRRGRRFEGRQDAADGGKADSGDS